MCFECSYEVKRISENFIGEYDLVEWIENHAVYYGLFASGDSNPIIKIKYDLVAYDPFGLETDVTTDISEYDERWNAWEKFSEKTDIFNNMKNTSFSEIESFFFIKEFVVLCEEKGYSKEKYGTNFAMWLLDTISREILLKGE